MAGVRVIGKISEYIQTLEVEGILNPEGREYVNGLIKYLKPDKFPDVIAALLSVSKPEGNEITISHDMIGILPVLIEQCIASDMGECFRDQFADCMKTLIN